MRLNCIDHYQAVPSRFDPQFHISDDGDSIGSIPYKVPVIRVFGATQTGQKVCAHVHGALPYLYIEYDGSPTPGDGTIYSNEMIFYVS